MFRDRITEHPGRIKLIAVENEENTYDVQRAEGTVAVEGTPLTADNLNNEIAAEAAARAKDLLADAEETIKGTLPTIKRGRAVIAVKKGKTAKGKISLGTTFKGKPIIVATPITSNPANTRVSILEITTSTVTLCIYNGSKIDKKISINWIAIY